MQAGERRGVSPTCARPWHPRRAHEALRRQWPYADLLLDIAKAAYENVHRKLPGADLRLALSDLAACPTHEYDRRVGELIADLCQTHSVPKEALADYLRAFPAAVRDHRKLL